MLTEDHVRTFTSLPPLSAREMSPLQFKRVKSMAWATDIVIFLIFLLAVLAVAAVLISPRPQHKDQRVTAQMADTASLFRELDSAFERHVEAETKKLCRYEWRIGRSTLFPERVMICGRG